MAELQNELALRFRYAWTRYFETQTIRFQHRQAQLSNLNPQSVLERGYSITYSTKGKVILGSKQIHVGDKIQVKFAHGMCEADVTHTKNS